MNLTLLFFVRPMARPSKDNCDYFPHQRDMRNHRKIKAIRAKFGIVGYGIWVMLLEHLTGSSKNRINFTEVEIELLAGDFGVSATEITDIVNYCVRLELMFLEGETLYSKTLDENLAAVYEKRLRAKERAEEQSRNNGRFSSEINEHSDVSATEIPQIKRKEKKRNKSKEYSLNNNNSSLVKQEQENEKSRLVNFATQGGDLYAERTKSLKTEQGSEDDSRAEDK